MTTLHSGRLENAMRLEKAMSWSLKSGSHDANTAGDACVMEAVAYVAGRDWSDSPRCVSNTIAVFMSAWNDALPTDDERTRLLRPLIPSLIGTATNRADEKRRSFLALDWLVRTWTPTWLDLVPALRAHAHALRQSAQICDAAGLDAVADAARTAANAARTAAGAVVWIAPKTAVCTVVRDAVWTAARDAVWTAVVAAAWTAACNAAWTAAVAADAVAIWTAVRDAARDAAGNAAWTAAGEGDAVAVGDALKPTVESLQASAVDLVGRMCAVGRSMGG